MWLALFDNRTIQNDLKSCRIIASRNLALPTLLCFFTYLFSIEVYSLHLPFTQVSRGDSDCPARWAISIEYRLGISPRGHQCISRLCTFCILIHKLTLTLVHTNGCDQPLQNSANIASYGVEEGCHKVHSLAWILCNPTRFFSLHPLFRIDRDRYMVEDCPGPRILINL